MKHQLTKYQSKIARLKRISIVALTLVIASLLLSGCAGQNYKRGVSSNLVSYLYPEGQMVSHVNDQLPLLQLPLRVGITFIPESQHDYSFTLTEVEKQKLLQSVAQRFKADKSVAHIEIIPEIYLKQGRGFITLSQVANMYDVDVMALVFYDQVEINELNHFSLAYWTIVGAAIVPGETSEFQTFVDTAVFDIKTRKLLFRAPGIHSAKRHHTAIGFEKGNRKLRTKSFTIASAQMTENLDLEFTRFKARIKKGEGAKVTYRKNYSGGGSMGWGGVLVLFLLLGYSRAGRR